MYGGANVEEVLVVERAMAMLLGDREGCPGIFNRMLQMLARA